MPAGSQISGEDGIINLKEVGGADIGEVPCLESWTLDASASLSERGTKCMKSNGDGGSGSAGGWQTNSVESKTWSGTLEFYYQEDALIPASERLDPTNIGDELEVELFPNDNVVGKVVYSGNARIENVSTSAEANGDVKVSVNIKGNGALTKALVA